jgi:transcriptional regulator with XRE-family HTH domain
VTNERLRNQIAAAGLTVAELASQLELDPKSVERWINQGRVPHRRNRWQTAKILGAEEGYLWPSIVDDSRARSASEAEMIRLYPHRGAIPSELWAGLFEGVTDCVDLLVYSGLFLRDSQDDLVGSLAAKAEAGVRVRALIGDPDSDAVRLRGEEEGIGDDMVA